MNVHSRIFSLVAALIIAAGAAAGCGGDDSGSGPGQVDGPDSGGSDVGPDISGPDAGGGEDPDGGGVNDPDANGGSDGEGGGDSDANGGDPDAGESDVSEEDCAADEFLHDGACVTPEEFLDEEVDVPESENSDPGYGGEPNSLPIEGPGTPTSFGGIIAEPRDINGDGELDQDIDVYSVEAKAGEWFDLKLESLGMSDPAFAITGPQGYSRENIAPGESEISRTFVAPYDGTYLITVAPAGYTQGDDPVGGDDWLYVGSIEQLDTPTPVEADLGQGDLSGDLAQLDDNIYALIGFEPGEVLNVELESVGEDADAVIQLWDGLSSFGVEYTIVEGSTVEVLVPDSGEALISLDAKQIRGADIDFELSGELVDNIESLGMIGDDSSAASDPSDLSSGDTHYYSFSVNPGQVIQIHMPNPNNQGPKVELKDAAGRTLYSNTNLVPATSYGHWYTRQGGDFVLEVGTTAQPEIEDLVADISTYSPHQLGELSASAPINFQRSEQTDAYSLEYHLITVAEAAIVSADMTLPSGANAFISALDSDNRQLEFGGFATELDEILVPAGELLVRVQALSDLASYQLDISAEDAGQVEVEPNDSLDAATPMDLGQPMRGLSTGYSDVDFFSFSPADDIGADEVLVIELEDDVGGSEEYRCLLRDESGARIQNIDSDYILSGCTVLASELSASETYYLEVGREDNELVKAYTINARVESGVLEAEPNNTPDQATAFQLDPTQGARLFGQVPRETDRDYFRVDLDAGSSLKVNAELIGASPVRGWETEVRILDSAQAELAAGMANEDLSLSDLDEGTYFIEITRDNELTVTSLVYDISVTP